MKTYLYKFSFQNGKMYIGYTQHLGNRMRAHRGWVNLKKNLLVHRAIKRYGWPKMTVLCAGSREYIKGMEVAAIAQYRTLAPRGYNVTKGGDGAARHRPVHECEAIRQRMRGNAHTKGKHYTEEEKARWGKWHHSEETKKKIGDGNRGKVVSKESRAKMSASRIALYKAKREVLR